MADLQTGQTVTSFDPLFFWQPKGGKLPDTDREPYEAEAWTDQGWRQIEDTVNGAAATKRNPTVAATGDRLGRVANLASGDDGVSIGLQLLFPEMDLVQIISSMSKAVQTASTEVVTLTVTGGANAAGDYPVVVGGVVHQVPLLATDTSPAQVATKIRAHAFPGWEASGADAAVILTADEPGRKGPAAVTAGALGVAATIEKTVPGYNAKNSRFVDKRAKTEFMIGFEGIAPAGGMFAAETHIRAVGYACQNTANTEWVWRETGLDALFRPTVTLECLPAPILDSQLEESGVSRALIDRNRKFNYFDQPVAA